MRRSGVLRRRTGHRKNLGGALARQIVREIGLRLDEDAGPAKLLEVPGLGFLLRAVGADLDEEAGARASEKFLHELLLASIGQDRPHSLLRAFHRTPTTLKALSSR